MSRGSRPSALPLYPAPLGILMKSSPALPMCPRKPPSSARPALPCTVRKTARSVSKQGAHAEEGAGWGPRVLLPPAFVLLSQNLREEPIHILNVAIQHADHLEDEELVPIFRTFVQSKVCWACLWFCVTGGGRRGCCGEGSHAPESCWVLQGHRPGFPA